MLSPPASFTKAVQRSLCERRDEEHQVHSAVSRLPLFERRNDRFGPKGDLALLTVRICCRARQLLPLRRSRDRAGAGATAGPCVLPQLVAAGSFQRQTGYLSGGGACPAGCRLPARSPTHSGRRESGRVEMLRSVVVIRNGRQPFRLSLPQGVLIGREVQLPPDRWFPVGGFQLSGLLDFDDKRLCLLTHRSSRRRITVRHYRVDNRRQLPGRPSLSHPMSAL